MMIKRIAVVTSGGDAPGMNAAIRAVVRVGLSKGMEVYGIRRGYLGLIRADFIPLESASVGGVIEEGGTILRTARSPEFMTPEGQQAAIENLRRIGIEGVVVIGGDGSMRGALVLARSGIPVVGIPATIDNDIYGTDMSIGADTALNTVVEAIDRIRDTASAHERTFVVETMGRNCGWLALESALATGADVVIIPEAPFHLEEVCAVVQRRQRERKAHTIIVVAEGAGSALEIGRQIQECTGVETRITVLGHIQRGGAPTAFDRILASRLGAGAVEVLAQAAEPSMVGLHCGEVVTCPLEEVVSKQRRVDLRLYQLEGIFSI
jgi:6-phosphofructokinase 1